VHVLQKQANTNQMFNPLMHKVARMVT